MLSGGRAVVQPFEDTNGGADGSRIVVTCIELNRDAIVVDSLDDLGVGTGIDNAVFFAVNSSERLISKGDTLKCFVHIIVLPVGADM